MSPPPFSPYCEPVIKDKELTDLIRIGLELGATSGLLYAVTDGSQCKTGQCGDIKILGTNRFSAYTFITSFFFFLFVLGLFVFLFLPRLSLPVKLGHLQ